jgi:hypothetical protein
MKLLAIFMGLGILSVNFANGQFNTVYGNILPKQIKKFLIHKCKNILLMDIFVNLVIK